MRTQVLNNSEGPRYIQPPHHRMGTGNALELGQAIILEPGLNLVDSKVLAVLRENKTFDELFRIKLEPSRAPERNPRNFGKPILEIIGKEVDDGYPLKKLDDAASRSIIQEMKNTDTLKDWLKDETRGSVRRMISEQMELVTKGYIAKDGE